MQHDEGLSGAERLVVRWLRTWTGQYFMPGVVVANVNVPATGGSRQVDMIVFSPYGCITVEIKGFTRRQDGHLLIPTNGPWTVDGEPAALHTAKGSNPLEQVRTNLFAVKDALDTAGQHRYVSGLVIVVPAAGAALSVGPSPSSGIDVVLGELIALRDYFHRLEKRPITWHVDDIVDAAQSLDLTSLIPGTEELAAEGFYPATTPPEPAWTPPVAAEGPPSAVPASQSGQHPPEAAGSYRPPPQPGPTRYQMSAPAAQSAPVAAAPRRRRPISRVLAGTFTAVAVVLALLVMVVHLNSGSKTPGAPVAPPTGVLRPHPSTAPASPKLTPPPTAAAPRRPALPASRPAKPPTRSATPRPSRPPVTSR